MRRTLPDDIGQRRHEIFRNLLGLFSVGRLVDLGAGHGAFARVAADQGWDVVAVDARAERNSPWPGVTWIESDVREFDVGPFDVVVCLGLFYHLTLDDQLDLLVRCQGKPLILDTHVATEHSIHGLSDEVTVNGFRGRWYEEESGPLASWKNPQSFWPTPDSLVRMLLDADYRVISAVEPWYRPDRTFFLALSDPNPKATIVADWTERFGSPQSWQVSRPSSDAAVATNAALAAAEARAEEWEQAYLWLRSRWPVRTASAIARTARRLIGHVQRKRT